MPRITALYKFVSVAAITVTAPLAQAGVSSALGSFSFTPIADAPDSGVAAAPIPVASDALMIVLGLLLAVVAVRFLRKSRGAQKLMSVAVLGCGMVLGGLGAQESISAGYQEFFDIGGELSCDGFEDEPFEIEHEGSSTVTNNCEHDGEIAETFRDEQSGEIIDPTEIACGATIGDCNGTLASGATCTLTYQNRCEG